MSLMRNLTALLAAAIGIGAAPEPSATLIRGARVFDGTGAPALVQNVLIRGDRIVAVGRNARASRGTRIVDARGLTLLPGLHDLHTHLRAPAFDSHEDLPKAYGGYLVHGVTSVNDFSTSAEMLEPIREMVASGAVAAPRLNLTIRMGVPGGHGTEYGWGDFFTMQAATPRAARLATARALPYQPDVIKVFADGWRYGRVPELNSMDQPTLAAIVQDAHRAGIPVVTHTVTLDGAKLAAAAGVDALGHGIGDTLVDDELVRLMKASGTAYVPTLVVYEPQQDRAFLPAEWRGMRPPERAREQRRIAAPLEAIPEREARQWQIMLENVRRLKAAGVPVAIGTDAGIGGVYHGSSTLREIVWLTRLGFTPAEALAAATSISARVADRAGGHGRIAPGQRADLVLTGGRPDQRIEDLYDVRRVFVGGHEVPLQPIRAMIDGDALSPLPVHRMRGPIDTGAGTGGRTDLDTLPVESSDAGVDHSHLEHVRTEAGGERRLFMVAEMGAAPQPFAQLVLPLTRGGIHLADASGFSGIAFEARGAGRYEMRLESYGIHPRGWFRAPFQVGEQTREIRIPFAALRGGEGETLDLRKLRSVIVRLEGEPGGRAWLELDEVRFY